MGRAAWLPGTPETLKMEQPTRIDAPLGLAWRAIRDRPWPCDPVRVWCSTPFPRSDGLESLCPTHILDLYEPYATAGRIEIQTGHVQYQVRGEP